MNKGFTLIELLVTITILSIVTAIGFNFYQSIRASARDSARKSDLSNLAQALEIYYQKNGQFIDNTPNTGGGCNTDTTSFYNYIAPYMATGIVPKDPKTDSLYCYIPIDNGKSFRLFAKLENCTGSKGNLCDDPNWNYTVYSTDLVQVQAADTTIPITSSSSSTSYLSSSACENYGDVNRDSQINSADSQMITNSLTGGFPLGEEQQIIGDVNYDNTITQSDADLISQYISGQISQLPVCSSAKAPPCSSMGDVTGDGKVTHMDAKEALRIASLLTSIYTGQSFTQSQKTNADANGSGTVTSTDSLVIDKYVIGDYSSLPACPWCTCIAADVNSSGAINISDTSFVTGCFNSTDQSCAPADIDRNGVINVTDQSCISAKFGQICSASPSPSSSPTSTPAPTPSPTPASYAAPANYSPKVLLVIYNPIQSNGQKLSVYRGWNNPDSLTTSFTNSINTSTGGHVNYTIAERVEIDGYPVKNNGFQLTNSYFNTNCIGGTSDSNCNALANYVSIINTVDACTKRNNGTIDELWLFGGPWFGYWESNLTGPNAFWYNSSPTTGTTCTKLLPIMGFSYEPSYDNMLHDVGHRLESTMSRVYGSAIYNSTNPWNKFAARESTSPGNGGCGITHYPVNTSQEYQYGSSASVQSTCDDFRNYPNLTGVKQSVSCSTWGCSHHGFFEWMFSKLPKASGQDGSGFLYDWWAYLVDPQGSIIDRGF